MIELLDTPRALEQPSLDSKALTLARIPLGSTTRRFPRDRIIEVGFSPIVAVTCFDRRGSKRYFGHEREPLELDRVIDSVLFGSGIVHFAEGVSFTIDCGRVTRFSLYDSSLVAFAAVRSWSALLSTFGRPENAFEIQLNGDSVGRDAYYGGSKKWVRWDARRERIGFIAIGGNADDLNAGTCGGLVRTRLAPDG